MPGFVSGGTIASFANDLPNTWHHDSVYQTYRTGTPLSYSFDVANGNYTVHLYFVEPTGTVNASGNRRLMDIALEGTTVLSNFSPFEVFNNAYRGHVRLFDVAVTDGVLNVSITRSASSNQDPVLSAISVIKR